MRGSGRGRPVSCLVSMIVIMIVAMNEFQSLSEARIMYRI
jgi:hypothetical protein